VDLRGQFSNPSTRRRLDALIKAIELGRGSDEAVDLALHKTRHAVIKKLSASQVDELVAGYEAGATIYQLAARFSIHRTTVSAHLHRKGIELRGRGLTGGGVAEAAHLYLSGWSLERIAVKLEVDDETVRSALRQLGVKMRSPHDRRSAPR
jgi:DNA-directed RNA polymerase specialized sigma24 family protein